MINFSICPHDAQSNLQFWKDFAKQLEIKLGEKINFEPFFSFKEEEEKLSSKNYHLYYSSPVKAPYLYQKGYKAVAKFKDQKDQLFIIGKNPDVIKKDYIKVAIAGGKPHYALIDFDVKYAEVIFTDNFLEVFEFVLNGKSDIGVMNNEVWDKIKDKKDVKIIRNTFFDVMHIFMAHISVYDKVKSPLLSFDFLEEASDKDLFQVISIFDRLKFFAKKWEEHDIATAIFDLDNVGVVIYQEKLVYANKFTYKLFGYSKEEALSKTILDFIYDEDREKLLNFIEKRLKGEKFSNFYHGIRGIDKYGKIHILSVFSSTILYKGKNSGFFIFFDITKHAKIERLYHLLREVDTAITKSTLEEEMFERVCKALVEKTGLRFVRVATKDTEDSPYLRVLHKHGEDKGYLDKVKVSWKEDLPTGRGPTGTAFRTGKIVVISNTQKDQRFVLWKGLAKKTGFLSVAAIPLEDENGHIKNVITMYSSEPGFFDGEVLSVLNEIKSDLEFAIERFYEIRNSIILQDALEKAPSWVLITDEESNIVYVNEFVCRISGYSKGELIGENPRIFKSGIHPKEFFEKLYKTIEPGKQFFAIFVNKKKNGELFYIEQTIFPIVIRPNIKRYMSIGKDITQEVKMQDELIKIKQSDVLTGLYNFNGFLSIVSSQLSTISKGQYSVMVLIDIFNFKYVNQIYGLETGDYVLKTVASRLLLYLPGSIIARISGDEFGIYKGNFYSDDEIEHFINGLKLLFDESISIGEDKISLSFHAGVSLAPKDGTKFNEIYEKASIALRYSKERQENTILFYDIDLDKKLIQYTNTLNLIERALKEDLFVLYYQPFFEAQTLKLKGFEALVRIKDKDGTIYPPYVFIDMLEESKFLLDFEKWLVNKIYKQTKKWNKLLSFNISLNDFTNEEFIEYLLNFNFENMAIMELTERIFAQDLEKIKTTLTKLREKDRLKIAIDDFGTEYSSLRYIKELPLDELKIDISFIKTITQDYRNRALVETIILLSNRLGFITVAEGVETEEHLKILQDMGCNFVQGYLLGKPMPEKDAERLIEEQAK